MKVVKIVSVQKSIMKVVYIFAIIMSRQNLCVSRCVQLLTLFFEPCREYDIDRIVIRKVA